MLGATTWVRVGLYVLGGFLICSANDVSAQTPKGQAMYVVSAGYSRLVRDTLDDRNRNYDGWYVAGSKRFSDWASAAIEVGGDYRTVMFGDIIAGKNKIYTVMGGVHLPLLEPNTLRPVVRAMAGFLHETGSSGDREDATNRALFELGGGVRLTLHDAVSFEFIANYRRYVWQGNANELRLLAGLAINIGGS